MSEIKNAIIRGVTIGDDDHGGLSSFLDLDYGGVHQGFGGYGLYSPGRSEDHGGKWIWRCMEVVGVDEWGKLRGAPVRVRVEDGLAVAIGHYIEDRWFEPRKELV